MSEPVRSRRSANDELLIDRLHEHSPVALVITSAQTHEILHANPAALAFMEGSPTPNALLGSRLDDHVPDFLETGLAAALDEVALTGEPKHLPEIRCDRRDAGPTWWSWSLQRVWTGRWGSIVVWLGVDVTEQVRARRTSDAQRTRRLALQRAIDAVPGPSLSISLSDVAQALVPAISIELCTVRLSDPSGDLHLVAAAGLAPSELRRAALQPIPTRRLGTGAARAVEPRHALAWGFRWIGLRWLGARRELNGTIGLASRSDRRPSEEEDALLEGVVRQLARRLDGVDQARQPLRARSLELARNAGEPGAPAGGAAAALTPRHRTILALYEEGLGTQDISELLVVSPHTVRTHVKLACRRLGVNSREAAVRVLADAADPRVPI